MLINRVIRANPTSMAAVHQRHGQTDGQTDRQTDDLL